MEEEKSVGYILPITHNEYRNYQLRMAKENLGINVVKKSPKIILDAHRKQVNQHDRSLEYRAYDETKNNNRAIQIVLAQTTGKGVIINTEI